MPEATDGPSPSTTPTAEDFTASKSLPNGLPPRIRDWRPVERLGQGGFAVVVKAVWENDLANPPNGAPREVAIKLPLRADSAIRHDLPLASMVREAKARINLDHPGLLTFYDAFEGDPWGVAIVMELAQENLFARLQRPPAIDEEEATAIALEVSSGLGSLHSAGLSHLDVRPANVLRCGSHWKLGDFGLAVSNEDGKTHAYADIFHRYIAPPEWNSEAARPATFERMLTGEASKAEIKVGQRWDVWALGLLLRDHLFVGLDVAGKGTELRQIIYKCLASDPAERYPNAEQVHTAIVAWQDRSRRQGRSMGAAARPLKPHVSPTSRSTSTSRSSAPIRPTGSGGTSHESLNPRVPRLAPTPPAPFDPDAAFEAHLSALRSTVDAIPSHTPSTAQSSKQTQPAEEGWERWAFPALFILGSIALIFGLNFLQKLANDRHAADPAVVGNTVDIGKASEYVAAADSYAWFSLTHGGIVQIGYSGIVITEVDGGKDVRGLAVDDRDSLFVLDAWTKTVRKVNSTGTTEAVFEIGDVEPWGMELTDDSIWVRTDRSIIKIDLATKAVSQFASTTGGIYEMTVTADAVWIVEQGVTRESRILKRLDRTTGATTNSAEIGHPCEPYDRCFGVGDMIATIDAIWITDIYAGTVHRIDRRTLEVTDMVRVGHEPTGLTSGGGSVWVANEESGSVSRIDVAKRRVVQTLDVGETPWNLASTSQNVWVTSRGNTVSRIDF